MNNLLIIGGGSVGLHLFSKLKLAGFEVDLITKKRENKVVLLENKKINVKTITKPLKKYYDITFLCVKTNDLKKMFEKTIPALKSKIYVTIQSTDLDLIKTKYDLTQALIFEGYSLNENKIMREGNKGWKIVNTENGKKVAKLLNQANITCKISKNIKKDMAIKILFIASTNALSAIYQKNLSDLYNDINLRTEMSQLFDESYNILIKKYGLLPNKNYLKTQLYTIIKKMNHPSSMFQDLKREKKTEIDFINGYILNLGKQYDIPIKINKSLIEKIKNKETKKPLP